MSSSFKPITEPEIGSSETLSEKLIILNMIINN